jgi:hypothetical protein
MRADRSLAFKHRPGRTWRGREHFPVQAPATSTGFEVSATLRFDIYFDGNGNP